MANSAAHCGEPALVPVADIHPVTPLIVIES
jgi:hypothetical protein